MAVALDGHAGFKEAIFIHATAVQSDDRGTQALGCVFESFLARLRKNTEKD